MGDFLRLMLRKILLSLMMLCVFLGLVEDVINK